MLKGYPRYFAFIIGSLSIKRIHQSNGDTYATQFYSKFGLHRRGVLLIYLDAARKSISQNYEKSRNIINSINLPRINSTRFLIMATPCVMTMRLVPSVHRPLSHVDLHLSSTM
jgi:hypothetical protein